MTSQAALRLEQEAQERRDRRDLERARKIRTRAIFAGLCVAIFISGLFGLWWKLGAFLVLVAIASVAFCVWRDIEVEQLNRMLFRPALKTDNRWSHILIILAFVSGLMWWWTDPGQPVVHTMIDTYSSRMDEDADHRVTEIAANLKRFGNPVPNSMLDPSEKALLISEAKTDEEKAKANTSPQEVTLADSVPNDPQRDKKHIRGLSSLILWILAITYLVNSRIDTLGRLALWTRKKLWEKPEGDRLKKAASQAVSVGTAVMGGTGGADSVGKRFASEMGWNAVFKAMEVGAEKLKPYFKRAIGRS